MVRAEIRRPLVVSAASRPDYCTLTPTAMLTPTAAVALTTALPIRLASTAVLLLWRRTPRGPGPTGVGPRWRGTSGLGAPHPATPPAPEQACAASGQRSSSRRQAVSTSESGRRCYNIRVERGGRSRWRWRWQWRWRQIGHWLRGSRSYRNMRPPSALSAVALPGQASFGVALHLRCRPTTQ